MQQKGKEVESDQRKLHTESTSTFGNRQQDCSEILVFNKISNSKSSSTTLTEYLDSPSNAGLAVNHKDFHGFTTTRENGGESSDRQASNLPASTTSPSQLNDNIDIDNPIQYPNTRRKHPDSKQFDNTIKNSICSVKSPEAKRSPFDEHYVVTPAIRDPGAARASVRFQPTRNRAVDPVHESTSKNKSAQKQSSDDDSNAQSSREGYSNKTTAIADPERSLSEHRDLSPRNCGALPKTECEATDTSRDKIPEIENTAFKPETHLHGSATFSARIRPSAVRNQEESGSISASRGTTTTHVDSTPEQRNLQLAGGCQEYVHCSKSEAANASDLCRSDIPSNYTAEDSEPSTSFSHKASQRTTGPLPVQLSESTISESSPTTSLKSFNDKPRSTRRKVHFDLNPCVVSYTPERCSKRKQFFKEIKYKAMRRLHMKSSLHHTARTLIDCNLKYFCSRKENNNYDDDGNEIDVIDDGDENQELINRFSKVTTTPAKPYTKTFRLLSTIGKPFVKLKQNLSKNA